MINDLGRRGLQYGSRFGGLMLCKRKENKIKISQHFVSKKRKQTKVTGPNLTYSIAKGCLCWLLKPILFKLLIFDILALSTLKLHPAKTHSVPLGWKKSHHHLGRKLGNWPLQIIIRYHLHFESASAPPDNNWHVSNHEWVMHRIVPTGAQMASKLCWRSRCQPFK